MKVNYGLVAVLLITVIMPAVFIAIASARQYKPTSRGSCPEYVEVEE